MRAATRALRWASAEEGEDEGVVVAAVDSLRLDRWVIALLRRSGDSRPLECKIMPSDGGNAVLLPKNVAVMDCKIEGRRGRDEVKHGPLDRSQLRSRRTTYQ